MSGLCAVNEDNESCFYEEKQRQRQFLIWIPFKEIHFICFLIDPKNTDDMILKVVRMSETN